nr:MAG TPA: minor tail protein [Caudoviricetes sp.]
MDNKERLGVELYLDDKGFTNAVKKAQQSTQQLAKSANTLTPAMSGVDKSTNSAINSVKGIANASKKAESELSKLKRTGSNVKVKIDAKDNATSKVHKIKNELNGFKGKVYTATVNVKQNLAGSVGAMGNRLSGAMFGATMQMAGIAGISFGIANGIKKYADFEKEMSNVKAISGATSDEFLQLKKKAIDMGAATKYTATESAEAFRYMGMAGWKTSEMIGGIEGIMNLASASGEDLATTSDIVTDSLSAFGLQAKDSAMFADVLASAATNSNTNVALMGQTFKYAAPVAGALGFSIQDTALAVGLMANQGIKGSEAGTALRSMMTRMVKPTKESGEAMQILGLNILDANGKMKPFRDIIKDIKEGMSKLTPESKAAVAGMLAGQEAMSGLLALVNSPDADFNKLAEAIDNSNGKAKEMAAIQLDNLTGDLTLLSSAWDGFVIKVMDGKIGGFRDIVQGISNWFAGLTENFEANGITVRSVLDGITSAIKELVGQTLKMEGLPSILSAAALAVAGIGVFKAGRGAFGLFRGAKGSSMGGPGGSSASDMTINALNVTLIANRMLGGAQGAGIGTVGKVGKGAGAVGRRLTKIGGKIALPLALAMGAYDLATSDDKARAGVGLGGSLAGGLAGAKLGAMGGAALGSIIPGAGTAVGGAIGGLVGGIGGAIFGEEIAQQIYDGITNNLEGLTAWFSEKWNSILSTCAPVINTIVGLYAFLWDGIVAIFGPVASWFNDTVWQPVYSFASSAIDSIVSVFSGAWESIKGVWGGVANWFNENVWSPIKSAASGVFDAVGGALSAVQARGSQVTGIPGHATGTSHFGGGWTEINERGGEIVDLPNGSRIYPHATTEKMIANSLGGSNSVNQYSISGNTFVVREEADIDRIAHSLFSMLESAEVNYGGV